MSRLETLIKQYCPNGVDYKRINEIATTFIGLATSVTQFKDKEGVQLLHNSDIQQGKIVIKSIEYIKPSFAKDNSKKILRTNDIITIHTGDVGTSAVINEEFDGCIGFTTITSRLNDLHVTMPEYICTCYNSQFFKNQIKSKTISDRNNLNLASFDEMLVPVPPLPVQQEIVRILDEYTSVTEELKSELNEELTARKLQYSYYSDKLLTFDDSVERKNLGDVATISRGGNFQKKDYVNDGIPCIHYGQIYTTYGLFVDKALCSIPQNIANKQKYAQPNDVVMAVTSENIEDVCKCIAWLGSEPLAVSGHTAIIHHSMNPKYLVYYLRSSHFFEQKVKYAHGIKVIEVTPDRLNGVIIPIPSLEKQKEIVEKLDAFYAITSDFEDNLPKEIELRTKQYEYYRDKLLNFKRKDDA